MARLKPGPFKASDDEYVHRTQTRRLLPGRAGPRRRRPVRRARLGDIGAARTKSDWKTFRDRWLARKNGVLTQVNDTWLKAAPGPAKREVGQRVNQLKSAR